MVSTVRIRPCDGQELANEMDAAVHEARDRGMSLLGVSFENGRIVLAFESVRVVLQEHWHLRDPYARPDPYYVHKRPY